MYMDKAPAYGGRVSRKLRRSIFFQHFAGESSNRGRARVSCMKLDPDGVTEYSLLAVRFWVEGLGYYPVR
jgi:hypothetical protein